MTSVPKFPLGAYLYDPSAVDPGSEAWFTNQLNTFTAQMGAAPQFMDTFTDYYADWNQWVPIQNQLIAGWQATPALANVTPVMTIPMASNADFGNSDQVFKDIIAGKHDDTFLGLINGWKNAGYTNVYARIGPEMNGNFEPWYMGSDPSTVADFVAAWQHIADLVHSIPGVNVKTVWNPADSNYTAQPTISAYPGDKYVDVIGSDIYSAVYPVELYDWAKNDGTVDATLQQWISNPINLEHYWSNPNATQYNPNGYDPSQWGFAQTLALAEAHNKPIGLAETGAGGDGTSNGPVDDPDFVKWLYNQLSAPGAPAVDFVNVWDINPSDGNWQFTDGTKPQELAAWQQYFGNPANVTVAATVPVPPTIGSGPDTLQLSISEDAYQGDAQFTVSVDGVQQGGTLTAQAIRGLSQTQSFTFLGTWPGSGKHSVVVTFLNDASGGSAGQDRNLYINSLSFDGTGQALNVKQGGNGSQTFAFGSAATTATFLDRNTARYGTSITPNTATTYSASATGLNDNIYQYVQGNVTAIAAASFNQILVGTLTDGSGGSFLMNNFNEADVTLSNGPVAAGTPSTLEIDNAMHGTIALTSGNYATTINVLSAYAGQLYNTFGITLGSGTDSLALNGDSGRTYALVTAGSGTDTINFSNVLNASVAGGTGSAAVNFGGSVGTATAGAGSLDVTGGSPGDTYIYHAGSGLLTVENFSAAKGDVLQADTSLQASLTETATAAGLMLSFGSSGRGVLLKGMTSLPASQIAWLAADGSVAGSPAPAVPTAPAPTAPATPPALPTPPVTGSGADTVILSISEDAYQGDAQFMVSVDGVQLGGTFTAQASHGAGQSQNFAFMGNWSLDHPHNMTVNFLNDAWGGSAALDRNLYVTTLNADTNIQTLNAAQLVSGPRSYAFGAAGTSVAFADSAGATYTTMLTPGANAEFGNWSTGLNDNIYQWTQAGNVTGIGANSFNMVQSAKLADASGASFRLNNFDESDATLSAGPASAGTASTLEIDNAMRGTVAIGAGNYNTTINVLSAYADPASNTFNVTLGSGADTLILNGDPARTSAIVNAGSGSSTMSFVNVRNVAVTGGSGATTVNLGDATASAAAGTGSMDVTGGAGPDTYVFRAGSGMLTVENFSFAKQDVLEVDQALQPGLSETSTANGLMLSFGTTGSGIVLHGVTSLAASRIAFV